MNGIVHVPAGYAPIGPLDIYSVCSFAIAKDRSSDGLTALSGAGRAN